MESHYEVHVAVIMTLIMMYIMTLIMISSRTLDGEILQRSGWSLAISLTSSIVMALFLY